MSIFLRQLEYYQGILILTTNLLDQCDAAFESAHHCFIFYLWLILTYIPGRIHFSIPYPDLDFEARKRIWKMFFGKATSGAGKFNEEDIDRLAVHEMNGRQVRYSACLLAATYIPLTLPLLDQECDQQCTVHRAGERFPIVHRARGRCARSRDGLALLQHTQADECVIRFRLVQGDIDDCK